MTGQDSKKRPAMYYVLSVLLLALVVLEIVALILWVPGTWIQRLIAALTLVGIYGLAIGFLARSAALAAIQDDLDDMTSPDIVEYFIANSSFLVIIFTIITSIFKERGKSRPELSYVYYIIELYLLIPLLLLAIVPLVAYALFHMLVVAMLSYIPAVLASAVVARSARSRYKLVITEGANERVVVISKIMAENQLAAKAFLIGIPSVLLSLLTAIISPFIT